MGTWRPVCTKVDGLRRSAACPRRRTVALPHSRRLCAAARPPPPPLVDGRESVAPTARANMRATLRATGSPRFGSLPAPPRKARPIQKDGTLQRFLLSGLGPAPTVGQPWGDPPGASTCDDHAAFASGCGPYLVRMIHGKKARPIQKDGTLQRVLVGGLGPAPAVGRPARRFHME